MVTGIKAGTKFSTRFTLQLVQREIRQPNLEEVGLSGNSKHGIF